jgi:RNA polymerase sigma-70 factor, ECF subfamily
MFRRERRSTGMQGVMTAPAGAIPTDAEAAFEELYRSSRDDVFAYVAGLLRDRGAAEDVTATAFERAYRRAASFDPERGTRRAWLFGIARNAALDELRRRRRTTELTTEPQADLPAADESAEQALRRAALREAMAKLSHRERELVALKFFAGLTTAEIATVISTGERAAAMRVHRTVEKLRRACDEAR